MGAGDGTVTGLTKLIDNGPDASRLNIVLVAEGFTSGEQSNFNDLCDEFTTTLQAETWFAELGHGINVFRLNVESNESGADDPVDCEDMSVGTGATVATFFDAKFCNGGIRRCLSGDYGLVSDTVTAQLPQWHTAAVLVNSTQRGGCAGTGIFWTAISSDWKEVVLHELGHAAFGLADEYHYWAGCGSGETDRDNAPAGEPAQVNVTTQTDRDLLKWNFFVEPATPVPTMVNPDCSQCDNRPNVLGSDTTIGLYEGAKYYHCGRFRPAYICKMRSSSEEFCRVCIDGIADVLANFIDDQPTVQVIPTLLEFGDVAHGLTMYRAFEVRNVKVTAPVGVDINIGAISGDAAFSFPPDTDLSFRLPAPVFESFTSKMVFVAFQSADDGMPDAVGSIQVTTPDMADGLPETVQLAARAVEPPPVDSVLVIDRSGSMEEDSGTPGQRKVDFAIDASKLYVSLLKDNDRIGIVRYNDEARDPEDILLGMRVANAAGKGLANGVLTTANLTPDGMTSIGGGIILGSSVLDGGTADNRAIVVLTDGIQNTNPDIPDATAEVQTKSPRQRVFAVGLGLNQLEDKLNQIASFTNGVAQITGDLVNEKEFLLQKLYVQILSDVSDEAFVRDPKMVAMPGETRSTSVYLGEVDVSADFIVVFRKHPAFPKYAKVWLEAPDGTIVDESNIGSFPNFRLTRTEGHLYYRVQFPAFPGSPEAHIGRWRVWVQNFTSRSVVAGTAAGQGGWPFYYSVMAKARSDFRLGGRVEQLDYKPGSPMRIVLTPTLYGMPVALIEPVEVEMLRPNGTKKRLTLTRNAEGEYETTYTGTSQVGIYLVTAEVAARTPRGEYITRYRTMTGLIFVPGKGGGGNNGGGNNGGGNGGNGGGEDAKRCCKEIVARMDKLIKLLEKRG